jgi:hypothetical protein
VGKGYEENEKHDEDNGIDKPLVRKRVIYELMIRGIEMKRIGVIFGRQEQTARHLALGWKKITLILPCMEGA